MNTGRSRENDQHAPLSDLVIELLLVRAQDEEIISDVTVGRFDIAVRRGSAPLHLPFRLLDHVEDYFGYLRR